MEHKYAILYVDCNPVRLNVFCNLYEGDFNINTFKTRTQDFQTLKSKAMPLSTPDQVLSDMLGIEFLKIAKENLLQRVLILLAAGEDYRTQSQSINSQGVVKATSTINQGSEFLIKFKKN